MNENLREIAEGIKKGEEITIGEGGRIKATHDKPVHPQHPEHPEHPEKRIKAPRSFGGPFLLTASIDCIPWNVKNPEMYIIDKIEMRKRYPEFWEMKAGDLVQGWHGSLQPVSGMDCFYIMAYYPFNFPPAMPRIKILAPDIFGVYYLMREPSKRHPHFYSDGAICSFFPPDKSWLPGIGTVADLLDFASLWLVGHLYWKETGEWIQPSIDHNPEFLKSILKPNDYCYCGSFKPFKRCCGKK